MIEACFGEMGTNCVGVDPMGCIALIQARFPSLSSAKQEDAAQCHDTVTRGFNEPRIDTSFDRLHILSATYHYPLSFMPFMTCFFVCGFCVCHHGRNTNHSNRSQPRFSLAIGYALMCRVQIARFSGLGLADARDTNLERPI